MGKSHGPTSHSRYIIPKTQKGPKSGPRFRNLRFVWHSIFDRLSKSQNWSNMTKYLPKLGQGPTVMVGLSDQSWLSLCICLGWLLVCFRNHSLSRLRCSGVASAYGWVTILLYCLWLNEHIHYFLTVYGPTLSSNSLTIGRKIGRICLVAIAVPANFCCSNKTLTLLLRHLK
jgi:hypothetical protein